MNEGHSKGIVIALATAVLSGVSVYVNAIGVRAVPDPFIFTTAKNLLVAVALALVVLSPAAFFELRRLSARQWVALGLLGMVGGSLPFLLFFYGLSQASAPSAAFIHKTLFIWVAILAVLFLGERIGRLQLIALLTLVAGNLVLVGRPARWVLGEAELCTLAATLLWAVEAVCAKRVLVGVGAFTAAFGRMGFGGLALLAFLIFSGRAEVLAGLDGAQWGWVVVTSVLLFGYVTGYYGALKLAPATTVASLLVVGSVVTSTLYAVLDARAYTAPDIFGLVLVCMATGIWLWAATASMRTGHRAAAVVHAGR